MTTIGATSFSTSATQRQTNVDRSHNQSDFASQLAQLTAKDDQPSSVVHVGAQPSGEATARMDELYAQVDALEERQLQYSNTDYLKAKFGLLEQIATVRLDAGEDINRFAIRIEDRVFHLAGEIYGPEDVQKMLKKVDPDTLPRIEVSRLSTRAPIGIMSSLGSNNGFQAPRTS